MSIAEGKKEIIVDVDYAVERGLVPAFPKKSNIVFMWAVEGASPYRVNFERSSVGVGALDDPFQSKVTLFWCGGSKHPPYKRLKNIQVFRMDELRSPA